MIEGRLLRSYTRISQTPVFAAVCMKIMKSYAQMFLETSFHVGMAYYMVSKGILGLREQISE